MMALIYTDKHPEFFTVLLVSDTVSTAQIRLRLGIFWMIVSFVFLLHARMLMFQA